jgi:hypothetical protein
MREKISGVDRPAPRSPQVYRVKYVDKFQDYSGNIIGTTVMFLERILQFITCILIVLWVFDRHHRLRNKKNVYGDVDRPPAQSHRNNITS